MKIVLLTTALAVLAFAAPAHAQDGPPPPADVIAQADTNHDGGIDKMEWAASPAPIPFPEEADTNHDGKIDLAELTALFAQFQSGQLPPPPAAPPPATQPQG
jgi:hypothetical protein